MQKHKKKQKLKKNTPRKKYEINQVDDIVNLYDQVINQLGIKWNITMGLNWIRPFYFINLDSKIFLS